MKILICPRIYDETKTREFRHRERETISFHRYGALGFAKDAPRNVRLMDALAGKQRVMNLTTRISMPPQTYMEAANVVPMKNSRPMAPPNSGPRLREIMKYGPPAGTTPFVAIALMLMAVNMV